MRRFIAAVLVCSAGCGGTGHLQTAPSTRPSGAIETELMRVERDIGIANIRRDKEYFERVEAPEFIFIDANGGTTTKADDVASLDLRQTTKLLTYDVDSMSVRVYGEMATVLGRVVTTGTRADGSAYRTQSRFSDVFVRHGGEWQIVLGHSSRIPAPRAP